MKEDIKVLYIDDNPHDRELIHAALAEADGFHTVTVESQQEFKEQISNEHFDIILSDFHLIGFDGIVVIDSVKAIDPALPVVIITGTGSEEISIEAMKHGAADYVIKTPASIQHLPKTIHAVLEKQEFHKERIEIERKMGESEERYRKLFDENPLPMWITDYESHAFIEVNDAAIRHYGYSREEFLSMTLKDIRPPEDIPIFLNDVSKADKQPHNKGEWRHRKKDGAVINVEITSQHLNIGGRHVRMVISRDVTERKAMEEKLNQLSQAVEQSPSSIVITDTLGNIEYVNPKFTHVTGYSRDEVIGKNPRVLKSGETSDAEYKKLWETITQGDEWHGELHNKKKNGDLFWEYASISPVRNLDGKIAHYLAVKDDITERKRAVDALKESEFWIKESQRVGRIGSYVLDFKIGYWTSSEVLDEIFGIDKDYDRSVQGWSKLVHPEHREEMMEYLKDIIAHKVRFSKDYRIIRACDGQESWVFGNGELVYDKEGNPLRMFGTIQDITDRKRSEEALRQSEEKYRSFFEDDLSGAYVSTPGGRLLDCNPAFAKMFGFASVEEALNAHTVSLYPDPKTRELFLQRIQKEKRLEHFESELRRRDGKRLFVVENVMGKFNEAGELIEIKGYLFDDTKRRDLERQLIQAQKMESLGTMAGGIAHDFNNILAIILGHTNLIQRKPDDTVLLAQNAETIVKATQRGASLVKQLLTFARKTDFVLESVLIQEIIKEIKRFLTETFPKTIVFSTHFENNLPPVLADATQIHQVLLNLCVNARDAMPHGGKLSISADVVGGEALQQKFSAVTAEQYIGIQVSDTGIGMDEATKDRIFEPFFTTKARDRGTGLGLATVYGIVEAHRGFMEVESTVGHGTTFNIFFPVQQGFMEAREQKERPEIAGGHETILIVDDEESMRNFLNVVLVDKGYKVLMSKDGLDAADIYSQHYNDIAIVLTDLGLPKIDGNELFSKLKETNPQVKVIMASGYFGKNLKSEMFKAGVKDFIQKPYMADEVLEKIRTIIDQH